MEVLNKTARCVKCNRATLAIYNMGDGSGDMELCGRCADFLANIQAVAPRHHTPEPDYIPAHWETWIN
jgi:hypothetical protein